MHLAETDGPNVLRVGPGPVAGLRRRALRGRRLRAALAAAHALHHLRRRERAQQPCRTRPPVNLVQCTLDMSMPKCTYEHYLPGCTRPSCRCPRSPSTATRCRIYRTALGSEKKINFVTTFSVDFVVAYVTGGTFRLVDVVGTLVEQTVHCNREASVPRKGVTGATRAAAAGTQRLPTELRWQNDRDTPFVRRGGSAGSARAIPLFRWVTPMKNAHTGN